MNTLGRIALTALLGFLVCIWLTPDTTARNTTTYIVIAVTGVCSLAVLLACAIFFIWTI